MEGRIIVDPEFEYLLSQDDDEDTDELLSDSEEE
jgi:hypothetical protein